jgi:hypothetical protein
VSTASVPRNGVGVHHEPGPRHVAHDGPPRAEPRTFSIYARGALWAVHDGPGLELGHVLGVEAAHFRAADCMDFTVWGGPFCEAVVLCHGGNFSVIETAGAPKHTPRDPEDDPARLAPAEGAPPQDSRDAPRRGEAILLRLAGRFRDRIARLDALSARYEAWDDDDTAGHERFYYTKVEPAEAAEERAGRRLARACKRYGRAGVLLGGRLYLWHGGQHWLERTYMPKFDVYSADVAGLAPAAPPAGPAEGGG